MNRMSMLVKRKCIEAGSIIYRSVIFPFIRMGIERRTDSIMCKGSYVYRGTVLAGSNYVGERTMLANVRMGFGSMVGRDSCMSNVEIGKYSCIANAQTYIGKHPVKGENISIHPAFYSTACQYGYTYVKEDSYAENEWIDEDKHIQVKIGNDVWIGFGTGILGGVTIGDGAVIGAGSLVTCDVEPYAIYAGIPAKKVGMRFSEEDTEKLLKIRWWDKDREWIVANAQKFKNPSDCISEWSKQ